MPPPRSKEQIKLMISVWNSAESATAAAATLGMTLDALKSAMYRLRRLEWDVRSFKGNRRRLPKPPVKG